MIDNFTVCKLPDGYVIEEPDNPELGRLIYYSLPEEEKQIADSEAKILYYLSKFCFEDQLVFNEKEIKDILDKISSNNFFGLKI